MKLLNIINHKLVKGFKFYGGRNTYGRITVRHRGVL
jgi:ribosomal protein L2